MALAGGLAGAAGPPAGGAGASGLPDRGLFIIEKICIIKKIFIIKKLQGA
jgi:hypothetical protein